MGSIYRNRSCQWLSCLSLNSCPQHWVRDLPFQCQDILPKLPLFPLQDRKSVHITKDLILLIIVAIQHTNQAITKISWADSDHSLPGEFLMRLWSQRGFPLSFRAHIHYLKTLKNYPNSCTEPVSHKSTCSLHWGSFLFPEVHTRIQFAATVPEDTLFWEEKTLSLDITHSSPLPPTPPACLPIPKNSGVINPPEVFQPLWPITN